MQGSPVVLTGNHRLLAAQSAALAGGLIVAGILAVAASTVFVLAESAADPVPNAVTRALEASSQIGVGLYVWLRRPDMRVGPIMVVLGFVLAATSVSVSQESVAATVGYSLSTVASFLYLLLFLAYPAGRIPERSGRRLMAAAAVGGGVFLAGTLTLAKALPVGGPQVPCEGDCPASAIRLASGSSFGEALSAGSYLFFGAMLVGATVILRRRMREGSVIRRRTALPVLAVAVAILVVFAWLSALQVFGAGTDGAEAAEWAGYCLLLVFPYAILIGLIRGRILAGAALSRLVTSLRRQPGPVRLEGAVAEALGDPTLEVLVWSANARAYLDSRGRARNGDVGRDGRSVMPVAPAEQPAALILHDPALEAEPDLLEAASAATLLALEKARLQADLQTSMGQLRASRARIVSVADAERRRLERDLHDGAQQQLFAMRIKLGLLEELAATQRVREIAVELGEQLDDALDRLRDLAHGIYPAVLSDSGLRDAVRTLAWEAPFPVEAVIGKIGRYPPAIEAAVYFSCAEALQNAGKHAGLKAGVVVSLDACDERLEFEVRDHGCGFDPAGRAEGAGVENMRDRVGAVGGRLDVRSAPGAGTSVSGSIPIQ